ncbi:MAG: hypothetical protein M1832_000237 [Thelocarpon impressellum]|nr:MAG: hypothetical protein M1832_000237 [Thelocarpon impressellum]
MAPSVVSLGNQLAKRLPTPKEVNIHGRANQTLDQTILEAWSQGFMVGGLLVLSMITVANMRRGVLLHKLILLELLMALGHGTFIFSADPIYGWHLSGTAVFLYLSWYLHNIIGWMKNKYFLPRWGSMLYIGSVILVFPYWVAEMYLNFDYFNALGNGAFHQTRPWEALARDPWWIFTTCSLIYVIKREYNFGLFELIRASPRFGVLILSMFLSIVFLLTDVIVTAVEIGGPSGINPYWKLALVFKCAADALFLDDFKKVLDVLIAHTLGKMGGAVHKGSLDNGANSGILVDHRRSHDFGMHPLVTGHAGLPASTHQKPMIFSPNSRPGTREGHRGPRARTAGGIHTMPQYREDWGHPGGDVYPSDDKYSCETESSTRTASHAHSQPGPPEWADAIADVKAGQAAATAEVEVVPTASLRFPPDRERSVSPGTTAAEFITTPL